MRVTIVGGGVVGTATAQGLARLGNDVTVWDNNPECRASGEFKICSDSAISVAGQHLVLIAVPEGVVENVVSRLDGIRDGGEGAQLPGVFIRSSVPPGTCEDLSHKYHLHIGHNPEFLRAAVAEYEFLHPPGVVIGSCCDVYSPGHHLHIQNLYAPLRVPTFIVERKVSELLKLTVNSYLATQISFWNQIKLIADQLGVNSHEVGMLASYCDERISEYGARMHGKPYGGTCLPKDLAQLRTVATKVGLAGGLLRAVKIINDAIGEGGVLEEHA